MEDRPLVDLLLVIGTSLKVSPVSDMLSKSWLVDVMKPYSSRVSPSTTFGATGMYNSPISWKYAYHEIRSSLTRHLSDISIRMWATFLLILVITHLLTHDIHSLDCSSWKRWWGRSISRPQTQLGSSRATSVQTGFVDARPSSNTQTVFWRHRDSKS